MTTADHAYSCCSAPIQFCSNTGKPVRCTIQSQLQQPQPGNAWGGDICGGVYRELSQN